MGFDAVKHRENGGIMQPEQVVREFIASWNRMDFTAMLEWLDEAVVYHNIPMPEIHGREGVKALAVPVATWITVRNDLNNQS